MADVSGTVEGGQSAIGRAAGGLGLLSRFLGAGFLVLLGGLLLLDRALLRANRNQARLDAQTAGLLTETFVSTQSARLDRIADVVGSSARPRDTAALRSAVEGAAQTGPTIRHLWVSDSSGAPVLDARLAGSALPGEIIRRLHQLGDSGRRSIHVLRAPDGTRLLAFIRPAASERIDRPGAVTDSSVAPPTMDVARPLTRPPATAPGAPGVSRSVGMTGHVGLVVEEAALTTLIGRTNPDTRIMLAVFSGSDTVVALGSPARAGTALSERFETSVRLPAGGVWQVAATHALTSRFLRWGLWVIGILGVLFLALGLLREQQRALHAADRSLELERLYSDVKRANQAKSEFLANVSHELRTPLNAIVGFVELLRDGFYGDLSARQTPPVDRIAASATHLRHLVDQVLDIAKIAAGRLEVHSETIVLRPFVLNVASELESLVSEKGLALSITVGASLPRVRTDPTHLRQILINLIGNAVKYTPSGTVSVRARLAGAPAGTGPHGTIVPRESPGGLDDSSAVALLARAPRPGIWVALQVVDTGVGIAPSDLERIFDEFEQVNAGPRGESMQRGTGLGLAISRRLARLIGGEISVDSEPGRGSTFTVWVPVAPADLARDQPDVPPSTSE